MEIEHSKIEKIKLLSDLIWERKAGYDAVKSWLDGIASSISTTDDDICNILYALEHFIYLNKRLVESLTQAMFRDIYQYGIICEIRKGNQDTLEEKFIERRLREELLKTRFVGVGSVSESGQHILYSFRQQNELGKDMFIDENRILKNDALDNDNIEPELRFPHVTRYIFIDDFCGSGEQCSSYLHKLSNKIRRASEDTYISYMCLAGTEDGISTIKRKVPELNDVQAVFELDNSFKAFVPDSRFYLNPAPDYFTGVQQQKFLELCSNFAKAVNLPREYWYGYKDCQLLLGFSHNTPDNTLPIFWLSNEQRGLYPVFKREHKKYSEGSI